MRVRKLKHGKATGKDEVTDEMIKGGADKVVDYVIWPLSVVVVIGEIRED